MCGVRLGGLPIQCPGMAKSLATPLEICSATGREEQISNKAIPEQSTRLNRRIYQSDGTAVLTYEGRTEQLY